MIGGKSVLAIIPARGGSKGLPGKNIKALAGMPLIAWTILAAKRSKHIDRFILSSDDPEIMATAAACGCEVPFKRPDELADDKAATIDVVRHAVATLNANYDYIVVLQPTSPLRRTKDIDDCISLCAEKKAPAAVSVCRSGKSPLWMYSLKKNGLMRSIISSSSAPPPGRRQDLPEVFELNGAIYVAENKWLADKKSFVQNETVAYVMPRERSLDIDNEMDFIIAGNLIKKEVYSDSSRKENSGGNRGDQQTRPEGSQAGNAITEMAI